MKIEFYTKDEPEFLEKFLQTKSLLRLKNVGMNCGCEYTNFPRFKNLKNYSRYDHSLGAAKIVWNFTHDKAQTLATLFHDIATPVFAHTIDFLNGDYLNQESTENLTEQFIKNDEEILSLLEQENINVDDIKDYHRYPICDNASPKLSSDRLEYTIGNILNFGFGDEEKVKKYYDNISVETIHDGSQELVFNLADTAIEFAMDALKCSKVYVSDEDRYAMQILSELIDYAIKNQVIEFKDLYTTEQEVISKLEAEPMTALKWDKFRSLSATSKSDICLFNTRKVFAKKRYIDPYIKGVGRLSEQNSPFKQELYDYIQASQDYWITGN